MPSDKFRQRNPKNKQTKFQLVFDEGSRSDFLTGFQRRKKARKKIALQEVEEKRKDDRRKERQQRRDALEEELKNIRLPDLVTSTQKKKDEVFDHPEHTVTVTTSLDLKKEHGGIGENQVDYDDPDELEEEDAEEENGDREDEDDEEEEDAIPGILRHSKEEEDEEEEASEDEQTTQIKTAKSKKNDVFTKRRQKLKKQMMKRKRGASQHTVKRMRSMKRKSLGKFMKRGSANKAKR
ncbi:nucleolar protein 12-like [Lytechinus pictus]|uniref:nucleolar protein 12-like n=1 Tax=Lytechinus pictus TaxID=7653 RepID=UPI0030BA0C6C